MGGYTKLQVLGITHSEKQSGAYALLLADESDKRRVPVVIGPGEAQSIAMVLEDVRPQRPFTHDLFIDFALAYDIMLKEVLICNYEDGIFFSELVFEDSLGREERLDSRTSDAVALALRVDASIYISEEVLEKASVEVSSNQANSNTHTEKEVMINVYVNRLKKLDANLKMLVEAEQYEDASLVRDEIITIREKLKQIENEEF